MAEYGAPFCANEHAPMPMMYSRTDMYGDHFICPQCKKRQRIYTYFGSIRIEDE